MQRFSPASGLLYPWQFVEHVSRESINFFRSAFRLTLFFRCGFFLWFSFLFPALSRVWVISEFFSVFSLCSHLFGYHTTRERNILQSHDIFSARYTLSVTTTVLFCLNPLPDLFCPGSLPIVKFRSVRLPCIFFGHLWWFFGSDAVARDVAPFHSSAFMISPSSPPARLCF